MPTEITRQDAERLLAEGARLVDVLPAKTYAEAHIPGAVNIPLGRLDGDTTTDLPRDGSVIVYCGDFQ